MCLRACAKCLDSDSSHACAKCHPCICCSLIHSIVSNDSVSGQRMRRLIWTSLSAYVRRHVFIWGCPFSVIDAGLHNPVCRSRGRTFEPCPPRSHMFRGDDHEIISTAFLLRPLIQEGQFSGCAQISVNSLED